MKLSFKRFFLFPCIFLLVFFSPQAAFAQTYGNGAYGNCTYNDTTSCNPTPTPAPNPVSNAASAILSTIISWTCTAQSPSGAPNLYEVDVTGSTAAIYFAPTGSPYDNFFVS